MESVLAIGLEFDIKTLKTSGAKKRKQQKSNQVVTFRLKTSLKHILNKLPVIHHFQHLGKISMQYKF